jgi:hypothetical protein
MYDLRAEGFCDKGDIVGLFQYLGPMWIVPCMQILEDLLEKKKFFPNPDRYQVELRQAGIFVERMEVAMAAVLHKAGRTIDLDKFEEIYDGKLQKLPWQQRTEIREFWASKPKPGLLKPGVSPDSILKKKSRHPSGQILTITNVWELEFEPDLEVSGYRLNSGAYIPLPPRGQYWPKRATAAKFLRSKDQFGNISYYVLLVPMGYDTYWLTKWLMNFSAESALSKVGAIMIGGTAGPIAAGVVTVLVPSETGVTIAWLTECSEGKVNNIPVDGITSGFNTVKPIGGGP